jgi:hypothetical protein
MFHEPCATTSGFVYKEARIPVSSGTETHMTRTRFTWWTLGVAVLSLLVSRPLLAIGPAAIVVHGGDLQAPIVIHPAIGSFVFMWAGGFPHYDTQKATPAPSLDGRRYLEYDVFWGWFEPDEMKPEAASQHGRVYLPTADQPAAVVLTAPNMNNSEPGATRAKAVPIPSQLKDFGYGRILLPHETAALAAAGVPMK